MGLAKAIKGFLVWIENRIEINRGKETILDIAERDIHDF